MFVQDIMSRELITVGPQESLCRAAQLMRQYDVGILPVVEKERVVGVLTDRDIVTRILACGKEVSACTVDDCMSKSTVCANPTQQVRDAARTMAAQQVRRVPVVDNGRLCGLLSLGDISKNGYDTEVAAALCEISRP